MNKLSASALGLACGVLHAICMVVVALGVWMFGWWAGSVALISEWYPGFGPSFMGLVAGAFWGFLEGFVGGYLLAWFYNKFAK